MPSLYTNGMLFGKWDPDDLFAYRVPRVVIIRDRKLSLCQYAIYLAVFIYVLIKGVILDKGYISRDIPQAKYRFSIANPDYLGFPARFANHSKDNPLPYCITPDNPDELPKARLSCKAWTGGDVMFPQDIPNSMFVTTRVRTTRYKYPNGCAKKLNNLDSQDCFCRKCAGSYGCGDKQYSQRWKDECALPEDRNKNKTDADEDYFIRNIEDFSVMLTHSVYGVQTGISLSEKTMLSAKLMKKVDGTWKAQFDFEKDMSNPEKRVEGVGGKYSPCVTTYEHESDWNPKQRPGDCTTLGKWLSAAGVDSLEKYNDVYALTKAQKASGGHGRNEIMRYSGIIIFVVVGYSAPLASFDELSYEYRLARVEHVEHKAMQLFTSAFGATETEVTEHNRHGVLFIAIPTGYVGSFNLQELLKTLVTATALLGVAAVFVQFIFIKFLPLSQMYKSYIELTTVDCSEVKKVDDTTFLYSPIAGGEYRMTSDDFVFGTFKRGGKELRAAERMNADDTESLPHPPPGAHDPNQPLEQPLISPA